MNQFKQLDTDVFEKYFGGFDRARSVGIFLKMARLFLDSFDENVGQIENFLKKGDFKQAQIVAHRLKGALRTVGGTALGEVYYDIEQRCATAESVEPIMHLLRNSKSDADILIYELKTWMGQLHASINGFSEGPSV